MIRRSFRIGLWLGLIGGLTYAVVRLVQGPKEQPAGAGTPTGYAPPKPWPRLDIADEPVAPATVAPPAPEPVSEPAPVVEPARVTAAEPAPTKKPAAKKVLAPWVDPKGEICPKSHPVKAKLSSKIFQVAGNFAYDRTKPDRCYKDTKAAEADGFRAAKR